MTDFRTFLSVRQPYPLPANFDIVAWCDRRRITERDVLRLAEKLRRIERRNVVEQVVLPRAQRLAARGVSQRRIAKLLNSHGLMTKMGHPWTQEL